VTTDLSTWNRRTAAAFDRHAPERARWLERNCGYRDELAREYRFLIPPGQRVLEVGYGLGDLLAAVEPERGVGVDLSTEMIARARRRHSSSRLVFLAGPIEEVEPPDPAFDAVIMSDVVGNLYDIREVFQQILPWCHPRTRLVLNAHSRLWEPAFRLAERLGLRILDLPVRYRERTYGTTNIRRFHHGALLMHMCAVALTRLKCR